MSTSISFRAVVVKGLRFKFPEPGGLGLNPHSVTSWLRDFGWSDWTSQSEKVFICEIRVWADPASQGCVRISNSPWPALSILLGTWPALSYRWRTFPSVVRGHNPASWCHFSCADHLPQPTSVDVGSYSQQSTHHPTSLHILRGLSQAHFLHEGPLQDFPLSLSVPLGLSTQEKSSCKQLCEGHPNKPCQKFLFERNSFPPNLRHWQLRLQRTAETIALL